MLEPGTLVLVKWRDAYFDFEQPDPDDCRDDYMVHTAGFVVKVTTRFLTIAAEELPDGDGYRALTHIPLALIEDHRPL